jgi:hypothetical protein
VDRHRFDAYQDPNPNFHVDADPDPDPDKQKRCRSSCETPRLTHVGKSAQHWLTMFYLSHQYQKFGNFQYFCQNMEIF